MKTFAKLFSTFIAINIVFSLFIYSWATDRDIVGLSSKPVDRFTEIFFMNISIFTLTGSTKTIKSKRVQILMSLYMLFVFTALIRNLF